MSKKNAALKAKLRRLCELKRSGKLQVPVWLHEAWRNGDHLAMAKEYEKCDFDRDRLINPNLNAS